jgi:hypothetical protein
MSGAGYGQTHEPYPSALGVSAATDSTMGTVGAGKSAPVSVSQESAAVVDDGAVQLMVAGTGAGVGMGSGWGGGS